MNNNHDLQGVAYTVPCEDHEACYTTGYDYPEINSADELKSGISTFSPSPHFRAHTLKPEHFFGDPYVRPGEPNNNHHYHSTRPEIKKAACALHFVPPYSLFKFRTGRFLLCATECMLAHLDFFVKRRKGGF
jgi:hypothetical protein